MYFPSLKVNDGGNKSIPATDDGMQPFGLTFRTAGNIVHAGARQNIASQRMSRQNVSDGSERLFGQRTQSMS
jgi:hypothetical protein